MAQIGAACAFSGIAAAAAGADAEHRPAFRQVAAGLVMAGVALLAVAFPLL